ncbi:MAG: sigma-E factor negative regulatory protein [Halioglobus sp.]
MSERLRESLSAMMDDEANELEIERVLSQIASEDDLRDTWSRYQYTRGALKGEAMAFTQLDISANVRDAIASEPAMQVAEESATASIRDRFVRPLSSLAVAASVTAAVVLGGQQLTQVGAIDPVNTEPFSIANQLPVGGIHTSGATVMRASYDEQRIAGKQPVMVLKNVSPEAYEELARQKMSRYMQEHAEHAALNSPQGLIPYARVPQIKE